MKWDYSHFKCTEYIFSKYSPLENQIKINFETLLKKMYNQFIAGSSGQKNNQF
jgi:hypothetical protein